MIPILVLSHHMLSTCFNTTLFPLKPTLLKPTKQSQQNRVFQSIGTPPKKEQNNQLPWPGFQGGASLHSSSFRASLQDGGTVEWPSASVVMDPKGESLGGMVPVLFGRHSPHGSTSWCSYHLGSWGRNCRVRTVFHGLVWGRTMELTTVGI